jgi:hypothetical protein
MLRAFTPPGGGGAVTGTGTPGKLAKFTGATALGDSLLSESGTTITSAATAETFGGAQTWTVGAPNSQALVVLSNAGAERTLVLDTISRAVGVGVPTTPATLLHASDGVTAFAGTTGAGVRLDRASEALFSSSDGTRSFRAGITASTAVVGTSTAHNLLLQRNNVTAATLQSGAIATVTLTAGGAGYTNGTYSQQALTGGTGTGATADIVVAGGIATSCVVRSPGTGYAAADALSCATIGAGAGFVATVATIAQTVNGSGNLAALGRIGAGTATPIATLDSVGLSAFRAAGLYQPLPTTFFGPTTTATFSQAVFDSSAEPSGLTVVPATTSAYNAAIFVAPRFDASLRTALTSLYGAFLIPTMESAAPGATTALYGVQTNPTVNSTSITGRTLVIRGVIGIPMVSAAGTGNTVSQITGLYGSVQITATNPVTVTAAYGVHVPGAYLAGAAHTVTNYYGLRLPTGSLLNGSTITNNWGISQEDAAASNQFSAVTNTFSGIVRATGSTGAAPAFSTPADTDTGMYFPSANTVRIGTGGSPGLEIDSTQNLKFNSGYGSAAVAYGCRAWVNFNGTGAATIRASGGISSITRTSVGVYVTNLSVTMPDVNYCITSVKQNVASNASCGFYDFIVSRTTTSALFNCLEGAALADSANISISFFR